MRESKRDRKPDAELNLALDAARRELPPPEHTAALWHALQHKLPTQALGQAAAGSAVGKAAAGGKAAMALLSGVAVLGAAGLWFAQTPAPSPPANAPAPIAPTTPVPASTPPPHPSSKVPVVPPPPTALATDPVGAADPSVVRPLPSPGAPRPQRPVAIAPRAPATVTAARAPAPVVDPAAEVALIEQARKQLAATPALALAPLREHAERFPDGLLAQERELMRIEALSALGKTDLALERAAAFATRFPDSPHHRRIVALIESGRAATKSPAVDHNPEVEPLPTR